jgi:hypothetical protein
MTKALTLWGYNVNGILRYFTAHMKNCCFKTFTRCNLRNNFLEKAKCADNGNFILLSWNSCFGANLKGKEMV